jgi:uncharacterized protein (TIGR03437 family)
MMKLLLLLAAAVPAWAQCPYVFSPPASQTINIAADASATPNTITVTAPAGCNWAYGTDVSWITFPGVTNAYGSGNGTVSWVASQNLGPGSRQGHIVFYTNNGGSTILTVVQAAPLCSLTLNPTSASVLVGGGGGSFQLQTNCVWAAGAGAGFLSLTSAASGTLNGTVSYAVAPNLCVDSRSGAIGVQAGGTLGPLQTFQVTQAGSPSNLTLTPATLTTPAAAFDGKLAIATDNSCSWSAYSDVSWLTITGNSSGSGNFSLAYHVLANTSAQRTGNIHVGAQLFTVTQQAVPAPAVVLSSVLNGASYASGPVSPGEIVALFGANIGPPLPGATFQVAGGAINKSLGGVQVLFGTVPAALLFASAGQVNAIVPYGVTGSTQVQVNYQGTVSNTITLPVQATTPGILTLDGSGSGGGAIQNVQNQNLSTNTPANPAPAGSVVVIYCVGGGVTNPPSVDASVIGVPAPVLAQPVTVTIGGMNAPVIYSGAVPYSVAGLTQINATVPTGLPASGPVPVVVRIGNQQSQSGVTVAVE